MNKILGAIAKWLRREPARKPDPGNDAGPQGPQGPYRVTMFLMADVDGQPMGFRADMDEIYLSRPDPLGDLEAGIRGSLSSTGRALRSPVVPVPYDVYKIAVDRMDDPKTEYLDL